MTADSDYLISLSSDLISPPIILNTFTTTTSPARVATHRGLQTEEVTEEVTEPVDTIVDISKLTKAQLQELLKSKNLSTQGNREVLLNRVKENIED